MGAGAAGAGCAAPLDRPKAIGDAASFFFFDSAPEAMCNDGWAKRDEG